MDVQHEHLLLLIVLLVAATALGAIIITHQGARNTAGMPYTEFTPGQHCDQATGCHTPVCGDGVRSGDEQCDDGTANGACPENCSAACTLNDCSPVCGDGVCEGGETATGCPADCGSPDGDSSPAACNGTQDQTANGLDGVAGDRGIGWLPASSFAAGLSPRCCGDDAGEYYLYLMNDSSNAACCGDEKDCIDRSGRCYAHDALQTFSDGVHFCYNDWWYTCDADTVCVAHKNGIHSAYECYYNETSNQYAWLRYTDTEKCGDGVDNDCDGQVDETDCLADGDVSADACAASDDLTPNSLGGVAGDRGIGWLPASSFAAGLSPRCCGDDAGEYYLYLMNDSSNAACCGDEKDCIDRSGRCYAHDALQTFSDGAHFCYDDEWYTCDASTACVAHASGWNGSQYECYYNMTGHEYEWLPYAEKEWCGDGIDNDCDGQVDEAGCTVDGDSSPEACGNATDLTTNGLGGLAGDRGIGWLPPHDFASGLSPQCCGDDAGEYYLYLMNDSSYPACCGDERDCVDRSGRCYPHNDSHTFSDGTHFCYDDRWYACNASTACLAHKDNWTSSQYECYYSTTGDQYVWLRYTDTEKCSDGVDNDCNGEVDEAGCTPGWNGTLPSCGDGPNVGVCINSESTNTYDNLILQAHTPSELQFVIDTYYNPSGTSCSDWGWGHQWLSKFAVYLLAMRSYEMKPQLSDAQEAQLKLIFQDAAQECTLYLDPCRGGSGSGDFCTEDYAGFVMALAAIKNLWPEFGIDTSALEQKYLQKMFTDGDGVLSEKKPWDDQTYVKMYNHDEENPHYGALLFVHLNDARYTYLLTGKPLPSYYRQANMRPLFSWIQSKASPDGSAYLDACHTIAGTLVGCNDANVSDAVPLIAPAGRYIRPVLGDSAFTPGRYTFELFNASYDAGNMDAARQYLYDTCNQEG